MRKVILQIYKCHSFNCGKNFEWTEVNKPSYCPKCGTNAALVTLELITSTTLIVESDITDGN